jgi:Ca-activated chloride channel family protein
VFNPRTFENSRPDGFPVLEIVDDGTGRRRPDDSEREQPRQFVPLRRTELGGDVVGPVALLRLTQEFRFSTAQFPKPIEAVYRFPLPGDAAVTGVRVRFGEVEIAATLAERAAAEREYETARDEGRQAALLTREAPDVFTLQVAGLKPDEAVTIETGYAQLARPEGDGWSLRVPLTTVPRFVRGDEADSPSAKGQPLAVLRDHGHSFALDVLVEGAEAVASPTHPLDVADDSDGRQRVRLRAGEVVPDRDCVLTWRARRQADRPTLTVLQHDEAAHHATCFLALVSPPSGETATDALAREVILLIDHSGSMEGAKWEASDWAVQNLLAGLTSADTFNLGLFHTTTRWFARQPVRGDERTVRQARDFLLQYKDSGGTELGVALEQALGQARDADGRARHVLIVTDAQVSDAGRILALVEREAARSDRRRVDVLCIDAAPNSGLANELAERGGGIARFLTSDPAENDIASALDEVLADWAAPVLRDLTLQIDRPVVQAAGRRVGAGNGGSCSIDLGDLPAGRAVWVAGRFDQKSGTDRVTGATFRVMSDGREIGAVQSGAHEGRAGHPAIAALFGARRVLDLELVQSSGIDPEARLRQLGYDPDALPQRGGTGSEAPVYAENARRQATEIVHDLLVEESLRYGIACSATAFVATRKEAGQRIAGTVPVANALAHGWSGDFLTGGMMFARMASAPSMSPSMPAPIAMPMQAPGSFAPADAMAAPPPSAPSGQSGGRVLRAAKRMVHGVSGALGGGTTGARESASRLPGSDLAVVFSGSPTTAGGETVLFDSASGDDRLPSGGRLTRLVVRFAGGTPTGLLDAGLVLALYVDDLTAPRARVRLTDLLRQGGERPLNVRYQPGQVVRLVLLDPSGTWAGGAPALEVALG